MVVAARLLTALVAGVGALAVCAVRFGVPLLHGVVMLTSYLLFSSQIVSALPEHFGISMGLLSVAWSVFVLDFARRTKAILLVVLAFLTSATTITNGAFPLLLLALVALGPRFRELSVRPRARLVAGLAWVGLVTLTAAGVVLVLESPPVRDRLEQRRVGLVSFQGRLVHDPAEAILYGVRGLVDPVVAPDPGVVNEDSPATRMVTHEPYRRDWPYGVWPGVAVVAWLAVLACCGRAVVRTPVLWQAGSPLIAWVVFNAVFHNIWGDEYFLFSPHWS